MQKLAPSPAPQKKFAAALVTASFLLTAIISYASRTQSPRTFDHPGRDDDNTPIKLVGERFFRDSRFSEFFYEHFNGNYNQIPAQADPVVSVLRGVAGPIKNPYNNQSMSCANCHFVEQVQPFPGGGQRAYTDFSRRSSIPDRNDGNTYTPRNSPVMVGSAIRAPFLLHWDGEFATAEDLVAASLTGRNMGWLPNEYEAAKKHIVAVVRKDDGTYPTETDLGGLSYRKLLAGDPSIPKQFLIPQTINIDLSTDDQVFNAVVNLIGGYVRKLDFAKGPDELFMGSPFNYFLRKNGLPRLLMGSETPLQYTQRLTKAINAMEAPQFVSNEDKQFKFYKQDFQFNRLELAGYQIFANQGRCIYCHAAPEFTDHLFHNMGVSQIEYESVHGAGTFNQLPIPSLSERNTNADLYLPSSPEHPDAKGAFRSAPKPSDSMLADLGAWVVFANPSMPHPQAKLRDAICASVGLNCAQSTDDQILEASIGMMKTPTLRALGLSQPYFHNGQADTIESGLEYLIKVSDLARRGLIRNADPLLSQIEITTDDIPALAAFLRSLNEDYN